MNAVFHVLLALAAIITTARVMGVLFKFIQQPEVIGEGVGGIMLGPFAFGTNRPRSLRPTSPFNDCAFSEHHRPSWGSFCTCFWWGWSWTCA